MNKNQQINTLTNDEIFTFIQNHLIEDEFPSRYFNDAIKTSLFQTYPLNLLLKLKLTEQSPQHHPEGNVWNHTMLVVDQAAKRKTESKNKDVFMWSALLHDIGKPDTTKMKRGKITSYDHDKVGAGIARKFLEEFVKDRFFIEQVVNLVRWHMQILLVTKQMPFADLKNMKRQVDIEEVALLGLCDRLGRVGVDERKELNTIKEFIEKCQ